MSHPVTIRGAVAEGIDAERLGRLAQLAGTRLPDGPVLLAEAHGEPVAAIGLFDPHLITHPRCADLALRTRLRLLRLAVRAIVVLHCL